MTEQEQEALRGTEEGCKWQNTPAILALGNSTMESQCELESSLIYIENAMSAKAAYQEPVKAISSAARRKGRNRRDQRHPGAKQVECRGS